MITFFNGTQSKNGHSISAESCTNDDELDDFIAGSEKECHFTSNDYLVFIGFRNEE